MPFIERVLESLQFQAEVTVDLLDSFMGDKSTSYRKMRRSLRYGPREFKTNWADIYRRRRQFYNTLNYLRKEGFVQNKKRGRISLWKITKYGLARLRLIKKKRENPFSAYNTKYPKVTGGGFTIVTFDIPERERHKRQWIRGCLIEMDFKFLQKSVWFGRGKIAEKFVFDLRARNILSYVHIFSVNHRGTTRELS